MRRKQLVNTLTKFRICPADLIKKSRSLLRIVLFEGFEKNRSFVHNQVTPHMPVLWICDSKGSAKNEFSFRQNFSKVR